MPCSHFIVAQITKRFGRRVHLHDAIVVDVDGQIVERHDARQLTNLRSKLGQLMVCASHFDGDWQLGIEVLLNFGRSRFEQIKKQLNRLVEVIKVIDFTDVFVRMKEILYVKVRKCTKDDKVECFQIAETFKAKVIDYGKDSVLMEFVQTATKNDAVIKLMKEEFESIEVVRGGSVGIESISMMER